MLPKTHRAGERCPIASIASGVAKTLTCFRRRESLGLFRDCRGGLPPVEPETEVLTSCDPVLISYAAASEFQLAACFMRRRVTVLGQEVCAVGSQLTLQTALAGVRRSETPRQGATNRLEMVAASPSRNSGPIQITSVNLTSVPFG